MNRAPSRTIARPLKLWIVRHGKAEPQGVAPDDFVRRLLPRGERQASFLAAEIAAHVDRPALVLASPLTRAAQTARIIATGLERPLRWSERLEADRPVSDAVEVITTAPADRLMIVGHNMQLTDLILALDGGAGQAAWISELRTGEAALIELDADQPRGSGNLLARLRLDGND